MDYALSADQDALLDAVNTLLGRQAGAARARAMTDRHDDELLAALLGAGFLDLATDPDAGPLGAALVVEASARELAAVNVGGRGLVAGQILDTPPGRIASAMAGQRGPVRFGADADVVLVLDGDDVRVVTPTTSERVETGYIYPFARVDLDGGELLPGRGNELARWWRIAIAAELVGLIAPALDLTVSYLSERQQFGKTLGSLQALQHRLAENYVWVNNARWSTRSAAWRGTDEAAAAAATYATMAARQVALDVHQLHGAIGFTAEYDLHFWTMRAQALRTEFGGTGGHALATTQLRWGH